MPQAADAFNYKSLRHIASVIKENWIVVVNLINSRAKEFEKILIRGKAKCTNMKWFPPTIQEEFDKPGL